MARASKAQEKLEAARKEAGKNNIIKKKEDDVKPKKKKVKLGEMAPHRQPTTCKLLQMPIEILSTILGETDGKTLLNMMQTCRAVGEYLGSRPSIPVWKNVRNQIKTVSQKQRGVSQTIIMPDCPEGFSEIAYARLYATERCTTCDSHWTIVRISALLMRLCNTCAGKQLIAYKQLNPKLIRDIPLFETIACGGDLVAEYRYGLPKNLRNSSSCLHKVKSDAILTELADFESQKDGSKNDTKIQKAIDTFCKTKKAHADSMKAFGVQFESWLSARQRDEDAKQKRSRSQQAQETRDKVAQARAYLIREGWLPCMLDDVDTALRNTIADIEVNASTLPGIAATMLPRLQSIEEYCASIEKWYTGNLSLLRGLLLSYYNATIRYNAQSSIAFPTFGSLLTSLVVLRIARLVEKNHADVTHEGKPNWKAIAPIIEAGVAAGQLQLKVDFLKIATGTFQTERNVSALDLPNSVVSCHHCRVSGISFEKLGYHFHYTGYQDKNGKSDPSTSWEQTKWYLRSKGRDPDAFWAPKVNLGSLYYDSAYGNKIDRLLDLIRESDIPVPKTHKEVEYFTFKFICDNAGNGCADDELTLLQAIKHLDTKTTVYPVNKNGKSLGPVQIIHDSIRIILPDVSREAEEEEGHE